MIVELRYRILLIVILFILLISRLVCGAEYHRGMFPHWEDIERDHFDARQQALYTQVPPPLKAWAIRGDDGLMVVTFGYWVCPYTGEFFTDPAELDADHIVPLKWAWEHGADKWDREKRVLFANDQFNILVVSASANRSKGARGPEDWVPANLAFAGYYILKFMQVCDKYGLGYPKKEYHDILVKVMAHKLGLKLYKLDCD